MVIFFGRASKDLIVRPEGKVSSETSSSLGKAFDKLILSFSLELDSIGGNE